jgi:lipopolysaccharide transport system ATP-binding protein
VGALLEVGTGFHLELTGRENIFLNGAILGMRRVEIQRRFDEIVAFSEIERFLDTPVKRYSSGMFMRLAFAVAAHLEAEILLVDEVLAVGDAAFQKKCLSKMGDVAHAGRTVLFVSHNMTAIRSLCARAALIEGGRLASDGGIDEVIALYLGRSTESPSEPRLSQETGVLACEVLAADRSGHAAKERFADRILIFRFTVRGPRDARSRLALGGRLTDAQGNTIGTVYSDYCGVHYDSEPGQVFQVEVTNQGLRLAPGGYVFWPEMWRGKEQLRSSFDKVAFQVLPADVFGSGYGGFEGNGPILWEACWSKASTPGAAG